MNIEQTEYQEDEQSRIDRLRKSLEWSQDAGDVVMVTRFRTALDEAEQYRLHRISYLMGIPRRELVKEMKRIQSWDALKAAMSLINARGNL